LTNVVVRRGLLRSEAAERDNHGPAARSPGGSTRRHVGGRRRAVVVGAAPGDRRASAAGLVRRGRPRGGLQGWRPGTTPGNQTSSPCRWSSRRKRS